MSQANVVTPGEEIGKTEEYLSGDNTYVDDGGIYAELTGTVTPEGRKISVEPVVSTPPVPRLNDIVVGRIFSTRNSLALIRLKYLEGNERREMPNQEVAALHISNLEDGYVENLSDAVREGDVVRGRVTDPTPGNIDLTTVDDDLGVISARCERDNTRLQKKDSKLECPVCGRTEKRKISTEYK